MGVVEWVVGWRGGGGGVMGGGVGGVVLCGVEVVVVWVMVVVWVGFGVHGVLVRDVVDGGGRMAGDMGDGGEEGGLWFWWCAGKF